eukprot:SAG31_NODE_30133_length_385_cov_0.643357_1_plen_87_part_01
MQKVLDTPVVSESPVIPPCGSRGLANPNHGTRTGANDADRVRPLELPPSELEARSAERAAGDSVDICAGGGDKPDALGCAADSSSKR